MEYETIEPNTWKPEKDGDSVEGKVVRKETNVGVNKSNLYHLETTDGQISVWGSTVLDNRMEYVQAGENIRITYKGTQQNKRGQDTKIFKVEREKPTLAKKQEDPANVKSEEVQS